jgi:signal transduction histidine kinase
MAQAVEAAENARRSLVADVAHELRTPLSVLQANLQAMLDGIYPLEQQEIERLMDQTVVLNRLVNDLHQLSMAESKQTRLDRRTVDVVALITTSVQKFRAVAEAQGVELNCTVSASHLEYSLDPVRFEQVLNNLIQNAIVHTPAGGQVSVKLTRDDGAIQIAVKDTGSGIPVEHLPHIFDRFYRVDASRARATGGSGLGLAIVRALVDLHGGTVNAYSLGIPGKGTTFTVTLPAKATG